jgi:hypothetical protein
MEAVAQVVVEDTTTASASFTTLPQTHSSLHIEGMAASNNTGSAIDIYATFNNITTASYDYWYREVDRTNGSENNYYTWNSSSNNAWICRVPGTQSGAAGASNVMALMQFDLTQYRSTDNGSPTIRGASWFSVDSSGGINRLFYNTWGMGTIDTGMNSTAITTLTLTSENYFREGSVFTLYGRPDS